MFNKISIMVLALAMGLTVLAYGQWGAIPHNSANPVYIEGFHVTHDDGTDVQAFSAFARSWHPIAPANSTILGTGDWTALVKNTAGEYIGYTARLDDVAQAAITPGSNLIAPPVVEDDVILVLAFNFASGLPEAHAYSAQTNLWSMQPLANVPGAADYATSRFVLCVRDGNTLHGFGARHGAWQSFVTTAAGSPLADGNVVAVEITNTAGSLVNAAFSGVLNSWADSPLRKPNSALKVDHNVASMRAEAGGNNFFPCAYSAYNGRWLASTFAWPATPTTIDDIADNVVYFRDPALPRIEAIGARPAANWAPLVGNFTIIDLFEDAVLAANPGTLFALSGLAAGIWTPEPFAAPGTSFSGTDHLVLYQDGAGNVHTFSPALSAWAPPFASGVAPLADDAVAMVEAPAQLIGYAARWNIWVNTPLPPAASSATSGGSVAAVQRAGGDLWIFDERRNQFAGPLNPGIGPSNMIPGRNLMVFESAAGVWAYSVQRSALEKAATAVMPAAVPPVCEENVAMFVDAAGQVYAYASTAEEHIWFDYPNGTEYQSFAPSTLPGTTFIAYSILSKPGEQVLWIMTPFRLFAGIPGAWTGLLWLNLGGFVFLDGPNPVLGPLPNFHSQVLLPAGAPFTATLWTQGVIQNGGMVPPLRFTSAPDPLWLF